MLQNFKHLHSIVSTTELTRSYDTRYVAEIKHKGLGTCRVIKLTNNAVLQVMIETQFNKWDEQWLKVLEKKSVQANQHTAEEATKEANIKLNRLEGILRFAIERDNTFEIGTLYEDSPFKFQNPKNNLESELSKLQKPKKPVLLNFPSEVNKASFEPSFTFIDKISPKKKQAKIEFHNLLYENAYSTWKNESRKIELENKKILEDYESKCNSLLLEKEKLKQKYTYLENQWLLDKQQFTENQNLHNQGVTDFETLYLQKDAISVIKYCEHILNNSSYIETFPKSFEIEFKKDEGFLVVEYVLPCLEDLPHLLEVKFNSTKKELKEIFLSDTQQQKSYDTTIYKIVLRTIYELFQADKADALNLIAFNGWVNAINKGTGKRVNSCIVSIQVTKDEFNNIDLSNVDPKTCFKNLKGISSSKLSSIAAIQPIIQINRNDKRFISSYDVTDSIDEGSNLAVMSWEDFEHLIREIFEKEFSHNGGEVKVTQASRDGGVDAIAFDPDPIRGGKIIIQAKRYTNTVGVSSVRDLYGTVLNEGATKGILVTTTDYGSDAYEFVKNKPLTLMNGSNLLYLLEKHGHKAKIDIAEAKSLMLKGKAF